MASCKRKRAHSLEEVIILADQAEAEKKLEKIGGCFVSFSSPF